ASQDFLWGYVREQVEEESTAQGILEKIRKADKAALLFIDDKLGQRL
ncbi:MAG TPA: ferritin, partial [Paraprevotella xylaniphila]|nr:ferritin [Paraprevotella xylaniphila]